MRTLLVALLAAGLAAVALMPEIPALFTALLVMAVAFLLAAAKLATDLIDLVRADLIADAALVATLGAGLTQSTAGNRVFDFAVLAVALATQAIALTLSRGRLRNA
jgi:hypothetical protein